MGREKLALWYVLKNNSLLSGADPELYFGRGGLNWIFHVKSFLTLFFSIGLPFGGHGSPSPLVLHLIIVW